MSKLEIRLLGSFQAELDGQLLTNFRSGKTRALLAYLAVEAQYPWTRAHLADLFWPDFPEKKAQSNLRNALWNLRNALGKNCGKDDFILVKGATVQFNPRSNYWLDVKAFFDQVDEIRAGRIHFVDTGDYSFLEPILYQKEINFLDGLNIDNSVFDTWRTKYRYLLHQKRMQALRTITRAAFESGALRTALEYVEKWIEFEPWEEAAYRQSMMILSSLDRPNAAISQYKECVERLSQDLGIGPQQETIQLFEEVLRRRDHERASSNPVTDDRLIIEGVDAGPLPQPLLDSARENWRERAFFGRQKELAKLEDWLNNVLQGKGQVGLISGEPGSGKTFLMNEFVKRSLDKYPELLVLRGQCIAYSGRGDPYLPFIQITRTLAGEFTQFNYATNSESHLARLWRTLPQTVWHLLVYGSELVQSFLTGRAASRLMEIHPGITETCVRQFQFLANLPKSRVRQLPINDQFTRVICHLSESMPILLLLDDLQWIDEGSASLLFHLGHQIIGKRVFILGAFRPEEVTLGRSDAPHPFRNIIQEFQIIYGDMMVDLLMGDGQDFIDALLSSEENKFSPDFRKKIFRLTAGHPLFTIELLRGMQLRNEIIRDRQGCWVEGDRLDWNQIPSRIEAVIARRFALLPVACQPLLAPACVQGDTFYVEIIASILKKSEVEVFKLLNEYGFVQHQLMTIHSPLQVGNKWLTRFGFRHALFQVYLYYQLSEVEKLRLHTQIGEALENFFGEQINHYPEIYQELAQHFEKGGQTEKAVTYFTLAGKHAVGLSATQEGINFYHHALALLEDLPCSARRDQLELDIQINLGPPLTILKGWGAPEMDNAYSRAQVLSENIHDVERLVPLLWNLKGFRLGRAEHDEAERLANRLFRIARKTDDLDLATIAYMQVTNFYQGKFKQARHILERAAIPREIDLQRRLAQNYGMAPAAVALCHLYNCLWVMGFSEKAALSNAQGSKLAAALEHPLTYCYVACRACWVGAVKRDIQQIQTRVLPLIAEARRCEFKIIECAALFFQNFVSLQLGQDVSRALNRMEAAMNEYYATRTVLNRPAFLGLFAQSCLDANQIERGLLAIEESLRMGKATGELWFQAEAWRIKGDLLFVSLGDSLEKTSLSQVEACFRSAYHLARQQDARAFELRAALSLVRLGQIGGDLKKAKKVLLRTLDWYTEGLDTPEVVDARAVLECFD